MRKIQPKVLSILIILLNIAINSRAQGIDHWETIIYNDDEWSYMVGSSTIPLDWIDLDYDANQWDRGQGGFGYGDDDDNTILPDILSVFIRKDFEVDDKSLLTFLVLHADFDDGFVAYLNGTEIARSNLGMAGIRTPYSEKAINIVEPNQAQGLLPDVFKIDRELLLDGRNVLAIQIHNRDNTSSDLTSNFFLSAGIADGSSIYREPPSWFDRSVFSSTLPILQITIPDNQQIMDDPRITVHLGMVDNGEGQLNSTFGILNGYDGQISIEYRGTSSLFFDKKGYGFETQNEDGSNNNVSLGGMPAENDWVLHGPYSDKSLLRNVLTYHIGNLTDRYAPRTRLCELIINDNYEGVYVLTEKIKQDKNRVDIAKLTAIDNADDDLTGGYIIKVDRNDMELDDIGWESSYPDYKFFAYVEPQPYQITPQQIVYIQAYMDDFESAMSTPDIADTYLDYIDAESFVDYFLVTEIGKHIDAFKLSFYMYKDKDSKGGKLNFGPLWDFNLGYGNFDFSCSPDPQGWAYEFPDCGSWHPFWARKVADIPNMQHLTHCRWTKLRDGPLRTDSLLTYIDEQVALMGSAVDRNYKRWPVLGQYLWPNSYVGNTYTEEISFLKEWLQTRLQWMDDHMKGDCDQYITTTTGVDHMGTSIYPNPATDRISVNWTTRESAILNFYDANNNLMRSVSLEANSVTHINLERLSAGLYTYMIAADENGEIVERGKMVVVE